jgi:N-acetylglucosamine-6-sulfatase
LRIAAGAFLLLLLPLSACGAAPGASQSQSRPNVVVLLTDDQTVESMRVMAGARAELAGAGTTFDRSFVSNPLCCPSRATLYTGQYSHNHGVIGNRPPEGGYGRLDKSEWLPVWLQRAGYHTVHIGKFMNRYGQDSPPTEVPPGWNEWYTSVDPSTYDFTNYQLNENGVVRTYSEYSTDAYSTRAVDAVRRLAPSEQPFFLSVAFLAPHSGSPRETDDPAGVFTPMPAPRHRDRFASEPLPPSTAFDEVDVSDKPRFIRRLPRLGAERVAAITENYRQELESLLAVDEGIVRVVGALREAGELDRTLIVFTSDNGFFHGEHRVPFGKVMVYEPSIRVPRKPFRPHGCRTGARCSRCCATAAWPGGASCSWRARPASRPWHTKRFGTTASCTPSTTTASASCTTSGATRTSWTTWTATRTTNGSRRASPNAWRRFSGAPARAAPVRHACGWPCSAAAAR